MKSCENLSRISVVLVEPQDSQNIGSVCRAMKCMGVNNLKIVNRRDIDESRVKQLSVHAFDVFEKCKYFDNLSSALDSCSLSVAFTRRRGKFRKLSYFNPRELADFISTFPQGEISLVFGRESNGLSDAEVGVCNSICSIETSDLFPSLNLSQAVQIALYMLFIHLGEYDNIKKAVDMNRIDLFRDKVLLSLDNLGFFKTSSTERDSYSIFIRDFISRGSFSESEMQRIEKFFDKLYHIAKYKNIKEAQ